MNFNIEKIVMSLLGCFLILASVFYAGYSKGQHAIKAKQNAAIVKQVGRVAEKEAETHVEINQAGEDYAKKYKELETKFVKLGFDFGRLRVKSRCSLPEAGTSSAASASTSANEPANGPGTGEINLDEIAAKTIELGADLDKSTAKIEYLQQLVVSYQNACTIH